MAQEPSDPGLQLTSNHVSFGIMVVALAGLFIYLQQVDQDEVVRGDPPSEALDDEFVKAEVWDRKPSDIALAQRPNPPRSNRRDEADAVSFVVEAPDLVKLGWGWSQPRAETIPTVCVEFETTAPDDAQESTIKISEVRDSYSLAKEMNISSSVSVKTVAASGSGKASFAKNTNISSSSVTYLVSAEVLNSAQIAGPVDGGAGQSDAVRLTEEAARLAATDLEAFQEICGEGFVAARMTGARAYMVASTKTTSKSERESVRASVKGSGWGAKVSAAAKGSSSANTEGFERTMTYYQRGGSFLVRDDDGNLVPAVMVSRPQKTADEDADDGDEAEELAFDPSELPENADQAIARIKRLAEAAARAGKTFEVRIVPYQVLENFPRNRDLLAEEAELDEISALWGAYATIYADLKDMLEDPSGFAVPVRSCAALPVGDGEPDQPETCEVKLLPLEGNATAIRMVETFQDMALIAREQIEAAAQACIEHEEYCDFDASKVRSPYAVRAGMPVPIPLEATAEIDVQAGMDSAVQALNTRYRLPKPWPGDSVLAIAGPEQIAAVGRAWQSYKDAGGVNPESRTPNIASLTAEDHLIIQLREPSQGRCVYGADTPGCISNAEIRAWAERTGLKTAVVTDKDATKTAIEACGGVPAGVVQTGDADDTNAPTVWFPHFVHVTDDDGVVCLAKDAIFE